MGVMPHVTLPSLKISRLWKDSPLYAACPMLVLVRARINNYIHYKVWDEITYPFSNLNCAVLEVWERLSNFRHLYWAGDYLPKLGLNYISVSKSVQVTQRIEVYLGRSFSSHYDVQHVWIFDETNFRRNISFYFSLLLSERQSWGPSHQHLRCHNSKISYIVKMLRTRKMHLLPCLDSKCCVKFQRASLKFHTKFLNPYIAKNAFYWLLFFFVVYDILELWRHKPQFLCRGTVTTNQHCNILPTRQDNLSIFAAQVLYNNDIAS